MRMVRSGVVKKENKKIKTLMGFIVRVYFLYNFFDPIIPRPVQREI